MDKPEQRRVLVVTPVFDDWSSFTRLLTELDTTGRASGLRFSVIAVDDGSSQPAPALDRRSWGEGIVDVQILHLVRNLGHQRAIAVGLVEAYRQFDKSSYVAAVVMDSDGEDPPADIPSLLDALAEAPDGIAVATRRTRH